MAGIIVGTTPTIEIVRSLIDTYSTAKAVFWNTNPFLTDKRIEKTPRLDSSKPNSFFFDFSEEDTIYLANTNEKDGTLTFQIFYTYDNNTKSNSERAKNLIAIYNSPTTAGATGSGGADTSLVYQAEALQPNVPIGDGGAGENGATFTPHVTVEGNTATYSWTNDKGLPNPAPVTLTAPQGEKGDKGDDGLTTSVRVNKTTYNQTGGLISIPLNAMNFNVEYEDGTTATLKVGVFD